MKRVSLFGLTLMLSPTTIRAEEWHYYGICKGTSAICHIASVDSAGTNWLQEKLRGSEIYRSVFRSKLPMDGVAWVPISVPRPPRAVTVTPPMPPTRAQAMLSKSNAVQSFFGPPPPPASQVDTNPPVINSFTVSQAVMGDSGTPVVVPFAVTFINGPTVVDQHSGMETTNSVLLTFPALSNHCYTVWCSGNLKASPGAWLQYTVPDVCPVWDNSVRSIQLPILRNGRRFYQLRST